MRHLDTSYLFVQDLNAEKKMRYEKVDGADNVADKLTKGISKDAMLKHLRNIYATIRQGRSELNPKIVSSDCD